MTKSEVIGLIAYCNLRWPHGKTEVESASAWLEDLRDAQAEAAHAAVVRFARAGREFPPTSGMILAEVRRAAQLPPPSFEDMQAWLSRNVRLLPYGGGDRDTGRALEALTRAGAHEAVCRFVQQQGLYAVRTMPDPTVHPLDQNQQADRRDKARSYERRTLPDWEADPTPGLALQRVREREALEEAQGELPLELPAPKLRRMK